jgi:hypothetical protein
MVSHHANRTTASSGTRPNIEHFPAINISTSQKGHGIGGILQGWMKRSIPVIKQTAKSLGKNLAVTALDTAYEVGRDILVNKKSPKEAMIDQGNKGFQKFTSNFDSPFKKDEGQQKKSIKRKKPSTSVSRARNAKRKRPNRAKNITGFRKVTL